MRSQIKLPFWQLDSTDFLSPPCGLFNLLYLRPRSRLICAGVRFRRPSWWASIQSAAADALQAIEQVDAIIREMSSIATMVAATVDQQNSAVATIAEGVSRASGEARVGAEAMSRVAGVTTGARSTASDVKDLADSVAVEAEGLEAQVRQFLTNVQAA